MKIVGAIYEIRTGRVRFLEGSGPASHTRVKRQRV
jgi:hypothetical protein